MQPAHTHASKSTRIAPLWRGHSAGASAMVGLPVRVVPTVPLPTFRAGPRRSPAMRVCPSASRPEESRPRRLSANRNPRVCRREDAVLRGMP